MAGLGLGWDCARLYFAVCVCVGPFERVSLERGHIADQLLEDVCACGRGLLEVEGLVWRKFWGSRKGKRSPSEVPSWENLVVWDRVCLFRLGALFSEGFGPEQHANQHLIRSILTRTQNNLETKGDLSASLTMVAKLGKRKG